VGWDDQSIISIDGVEVEGIETVVIGSIGDICKRWLSRSPGLLPSSPTFELEVGRVASNTVPFKGFSTDVIIVALCRGSWWPSPTIVDIPVFDMCAEVQSNLSFWSHPGSAKLVSYIGVNAAVGVLNSNAGLLDARVVTKGLLVNENIVCVVGALYWETGNCNPDDASNGSLLLPIGPLFIVFISINLHFTILY
jgi:hypothetical protein